MPEFCDFGARSGLNDVVAVVANSGGCCVKCYVAPRVT